MSDHRLDVYFSGGSHLGNRGVSPTQSFPVLVTRRLRAAWGPALGTSRSILLPDSSTVFIERLAGKRTPGRRFVLVLIPRSVHFGIVPWTVRGWLARLGRGGAMPAGIEPVDDMKQEDPPSPAIRGHAAVNAGMAVLFAGALPFRVRTYVALLRQWLDAARAQGAQLVVLGTPVPLSRSRFPGTRAYQAAFARGIRTLAGPDVAIADVFRALSDAEHQDVRLGDDPFHLTADGHRIVADTLTRVLIGRSAVDRVPEARS